MKKKLKKPKVEQMPEGNSTKTEPRDTDRRCFIKKAIVAAPIILTVTSRPVWARNCTASGLLSGNLSDNEGPPCGGCPPDYWKEHAGDWTLENWTQCQDYTYPPTLDSKFYKVFCCDNQGFFGNMTLLDVLDNGDPFGIHSIAALYNSMIVGVLPNYSFAYSKYEVISMVSQAYGDADKRCNVTSIFEVVNEYGCCPW
jgi:hypothetical protein